MTALDKSLAGDTWGISGPAFLLGYGTVLATTTAVALLGRAFATSRRRATNLQKLTAVELAMIRIGPRQAILTALVNLRGAGLIDATGCPRQPFAAPATLDPFTRAVYLDRTKRPSSPAAAEVIETHVRPALGVLVADLARRGLLASATYRRLARSWALLPLALLVLAIARLQAGIANHKPVGYLVLLASATLVIAALLAARAPRQTRAGRAAVSARSAEHQTLRPVMHPSWTSYPSGSVALAVALFGITTLATADPDFLTGAALAASSTRADGGGSWFASSSGCGSSGGSSCGGGGGCGGGGCGG